MRPLRGSSQACWSIAAGSCLPETGCSSSAVSVRTPRVTTTFVPLNWACLSSGSSHGSNSCLWWLMNMARAPGPGRDAGGGRLVQLAVAARRDNRLDVEMIAADIGQHIADDAERRD